MKYNLIKLNTARNCFRYIIKAFNIKTVYIPYYLCPAIRNAAVKEHCTIVFYHIDRTFYPVCEFPDDAYILYPNYFGVCSKNVEKLANKYPNLIIDNAHSFYSNPQGIAAFNSLRKFFPCLREGAFLYTTKLADYEIPIGDFEYEKKILNYQEICQNEARLDNEDIKYISPCTEKYFETSEKEDRVKKIKYWKNLLDCKNSLFIEINAEDLPFCYPYLAKTQEAADEFVKLLKEEPYRYWTNMPDSFEEKIFYTNLVAVM